MEGDRLVCPNCHCILFRVSAKAAGMTCPRCLTWLPFESSCGGASCFTCTMSHDAGEPDCLDFTKQGTCSQESPQKPKAGWQSLFNWLPASK